MNVLQLTLGFSPSGRSRAIRTLAEELGNLGVRSCLGCVEESATEDLGDQGPFESVVELDRLRNPTTVCVNRLLRLCEEQRIDLIHAHDAASQWLAVRVRRRRPRVKVVMTFHRSLGFESARRRDRLRNAIAGVFTSAIVVGSRERARHYLTENMVAARKVVRIPFGIDLGRFRPDEVARESVRRELGVQPGEVLFGCVGHFGPEKGLDVAIDGFARYLNRYPQVGARLAVFGQGRPEQSEAMREIAARAGAGRVIFLGFRCNIERYLCGLDAFVHTPRLEAFGLAVVEAMATGLPVVAANVGGVPDLVAHRETGLLIGNESPDEVAVALAELADDPDARRRWGASALGTATHNYSAELFAKRHAALYGDVVGKTGPVSMDHYLTRPAIAGFDSDGLGGQPARSLHHV
jgi:glycosyltransferase involved in cell wall biosynthesis